MIKKIFMHNQRGVSPVIAVILMVAITVVLSGLLWAILQVNTAQPKAINLSATTKDESFGWKVTITGVSQNTLNIDNLKIQMVNSEGTLTYQLTIVDANPAPFMKKLSKIYAMTLNSSAVQDSTTSGDIDGNSAFDNYLGCYIAYIDEDADNKVNEGDKFYIYRDYDNDGANDLLNNVKFKIFIEDELALSKIL